MFLAAPASSGRIALPSCINWIPILTSGATSRIRLAILAKAGMYLSSSILAIDSVPRLEISGHVPPTITKPAPPLARST